MLRTSLAWPSPPNSFAPLKTYGLAVEFPKMYLQTCTQAHILYVIGDSGFAWHVLPSVLAFAAWPHPASPHLNLCKCWVGSCQVNSVSNLAQSITLSALHANWWVLQSQRQALNSLTEFAARIGS